MVSYFVLQLVEGTGEDADFVAHRDFKASTGRLLPSGTAGSVGNETFFMASLQVSGTERAAASFLGQCMWRQLVI
jgi:hypothetical protein